ncbi:MAG TPA: CRISPR-associated protein Csx15 [Pyrinomonadaceae bacterium]|nr:CRISPR-associated protein Csx15 [Pyrinomonadaceae bacterium]
MLIVNFSHVLTPAHLAAVERLTGRAVSGVVEVKTQFDESRPFAEQAQGLVDAAGLTSERWQTEPLLVCLPSYNYAAAAVLAELHGRAGYFPAALRLRPIAGSTPPQFEVAEILNLQATREEARRRR